MSTDSEKKTARESEKVLKARIRLIRRIASLNAQVTQKAINNKSLEIQQWVLRHSGQRTPLRLKSICLFDKNRNSAPTSKIVENALRRIGVITPQKDKKVEV